MSYIQLIVPRKLDIKIVKKWVDCVEFCLPSGMISTTTIVVDNTKKETKIYSKILENKKVSYTIPLVRNIDSSEIHNIVKRWNIEYPEGNFIIDYSQQEYLDKPLGLEEKKIDAVLDAWAKKEHGKWLSEHQKNGWKYGIRMSTVQKTHPWMQPWEQLPEIAKSQQKHSVKDLLDLLNDVGYTIIQKPEA